MKNFAKEAGVEGDEVTLAYRVPMSPKGLTA